MHFELKMVNKILQYLIMNELKIVSLNCRGLNNSNKRRDVLDYLGKTKGDIYCLQDVHWNERLIE